VAGIPKPQKCVGNWFAMQRQVHWTTGKIKIWIFHVFLENVHLANLLKSFLCMFVLWNLCTPVTFPLSDVAAPFSIDPTKCCCTHTLHWKFNPTQHGFPSVKQYHEKPIHEYLSMCSGS